MDGPRFDAIAKRFAGRLSRRAALGRGAGVAALVSATGFGNRAAAQQLPVCTDPSRPGVGCACTTGTQNPCGDTTLECCINDPNGAPGSAGTCTPGSVGCSPLGPPPTPTAPPAPPPPPCTGRGCRCNVGVAGGCNANLTCCPDNPGLPVGPGRCVRPNHCNLGPCTGEGCDCHAGVENACDNGLVCCADDSSQPGGPGRCEAEDVCFGNQCQATTNPCPSACDDGANCSGCCSGYCGGDGHCAAAPCTGAGCECTTGTQSPCDDGLVCCSSGGPPGGPGTCADESSCDTPGDAAAVGATNPDAAVGATPVQ